MGELLFSFEAEAENQLTFYLALFISIGGLLGTVLLLRQKVERTKRNQNLLLAMLLFFVFMIAGGTAFFTWLTNKKLDPVLLYTDSIKTPYGLAKFEMINKINQYEDKQTSPLNPSIVKERTTILLIEEINGKTHALSAKNYEINKIYGELKRSMDEWKARNNEK